MSSGKDKLPAQHSSEESDENQDGNDDFFQEIVNRMRVDINHTINVVRQNIECSLVTRRTYLSAENVYPRQLTTEHHNRRHDDKQDYLNLANQGNRRSTINWEHRTPFVFTTPAKGYRGNIPEDGSISTDGNGSDSQAKSDIDLVVTSPRMKHKDTTACKVNITEEAEHTSKTQYSNSSQIDTTDNATTLQTTTIAITDAPLCNSEDSVDFSDHAGKTSSDVIMGNKVNDNDNTTSNEESKQVAWGTATIKSMKKLPVRSIVSGQQRNVNEQLRRLSGDSPSIVPEETCGITGSHCQTSGDSCTRSGSVVMHGSNTIETRRRNFSSSSLPLSLMTATIEEVDDAEHTVVTPCTHAQNAQRSHSYSESVTPSARVSFRALRREARVPSMSSPPRTRRTGPIVGLMRSASDNQHRVTVLKDVDIVGESFKSRYPWQRDVGVQCNMASDTTIQPNSTIQPNLHRAMSGPASYTYFRSLPRSSNSPTSSPTMAVRRSTLHCCNRSYSHSDLDHQHPVNIAYDPTSTYYRQIGLNRSLSNAAAPSSINKYDYSVHDLNSVGHHYNSRCADFRRRSRPRSMGAVETIRPWDISRQTSLNSLEFEDDIMRYLDVSENPDDLLECSEECLMRDDVLPSPPISSRLCVTVDDDEDVEDSDESANMSPDQVFNLHQRMRRNKQYGPPSAGRPLSQAWMEEVPLLESEASVSSEERSKPASRLSMRRKLWKQNWKLKRGLTCDNILFKPPPDLIPQPRRLSSGSVTSDAESESNEPAPPAARRGRRSAIYETKNCGDVSPTTLSPDISPSNSCDEGEGASNIAERLRRRRSSVDLAMNIYPGDLLVQEHHRKLIKRNTIADFYAGRQPNGSGPLPPGVGPGSGEASDVNKKGRQPFSLLKLMKTRSKESLTKLDEILKRIKPSEFKDNHLAAYKSLHWSDLIASSDKQQNNQTASISDTERKRREAVWELFKSECVFLIDHLMVLKHCFMEPLKKVQVEGGLMYAEPQDLFGNLDELSYVSYTFCKDFISALLKDMSITDFGRTNVLLQAFQRFSAHSRDGAVYHSYCLNYTNALTYLEKLRSNSEFAEFEKWCEQDPRCNRLQLTDLLVAPMQHCTKLPLLLHNVRKYTADEDERQQVTESIEKVETSLKKLEEKMRWIKNFERVQEIQRQTVWPTVTELDPRCVIPESLKPSLNKQPCEKLLACPKRQLLHEGQITLIETPKPLDVHVFLFDDILLISKVKKIPRKSKQLNSDVQTPGQSDRTSYIVLRQPLALDRFMLHDISPTDAAASGLKHCFTLVQVSRYQQVTGVFTFQAACDTTKGTWLTQIREAMDAYAKAASSTNSSTKVNKDSKPEEKEPARSSERGEFCIFSPRRRLQNGHSNSLRGVPTKSRSMDAVFI